MTAKRRQSHRATGWAVALVLNRMEIRFDKDHRFPDPRNLFVCVKEKGAPPF